MKLIRTLVIGFSLSGMFLVGVSCQKYRKYDNMEVVENTFPGEILITSAGNYPGGDFTGENESGKYVFVWDNTSEKARLDYDITTSTGSVQFILKDAKGDEVLNVTRSAGGNDTFSGVSEEGKKGKWMVEIVLTNFNGDGSFDLTPVN